MSDWKAQWEGDGEGVHDGAEPRLISGLDADTQRLSQDEPGPEREAARLFGANLLAAIFVGDSESRMKMANFYRGTVVLLWQGGPVRPVGERKKYICKSLFLKPSVQ